MKTSRLVTLLIFLGLVIGSVWLLLSASPKHLKRQETQVEITDNFER